MSPDRTPRALRPAAGAAVFTLACAAGLTVGLGGSFLEPGPWFGPRDAFEQLQRPAPGRVLVGDAALVLADSVHHYGPPPMAAGTLAFVRGRRHGQHATLAECHDGGRIQIGDEPATTWRRGGASLPDLAAQALCAGHPMTVDPQPEGAPA